MEEENGVWEETKKRLESLYGLKSGGREEERNTREEGKQGTSRRIQYSAESRSDRDRRGPGAFEVEAGIGIGELKIGMSEKEAEHALEQYRERNLFYFFDIEYDEAGTVVEIETDQATGLAMGATLDGGIRLFEVEVEDLLPALKCYGTDVAEEDAYSYDYEQAGISFWRERIVSKADLEQEWFLELSAENREDERRGLFFESVRVKRKQIG
ncbi:hypothetical protein [Saccharibacillus sacchari]|uniref:Uncharacterized protein n=1 Tax=Saccharibacillus sacchari TaxID=456493 RepID=A0ACC6PJB9_9BACL